MPHTTTVGPHIPYPIGLRLIEFGPAGGGDAFVDRPLQPGRQSEPAVALREVHPRQTAVELVAEELTRRCRRRRVLLEQVVDEVAHLLGIGAEWRVDHSHRHDGTGVPGAMTTRDEGARGTLASECPGRPAPPAIAVLPVIFALVSASTACTGDDADTVPLATDEPAPSDTGPTTTSARSTPFCAGMIELAERLDGADATDDTAAMIRESYADLADVVPDDIRADFEAVRALLVDQAEGIPTTTTDAPVPTTDDVTDATAATGDGEGAAIPDSPTERLADYVELICRSTANNPGPAETEPP